MSKSTRLIILLLLFLVQPVLASPVAVEPDEFYYGGTPTERHYIYSGPHGYTKVTYFEQFTVDSPTLNGLLAQPEFFLTGLKVYQNTVYQFFLGTDFHESLFNRKRANWETSYVIKRRQNQLPELVLPSGKHQQLKTVSVNVVESNKKGVFSRRTILPGCTLLYQAWQSRGFLNEVSPEQVASLNQPERAMTCWQGTVASRSLFVEQVDEATYYVFIKDRDQYRHTTEFLPVSIKDQPDRLFAEYRDKVYQFDPVPTGSLHAYYYLKVRDEHQLKDIADIDVVSLLFPEPSPPLIDSDIFIRVGCRDAAAIMAKRERDYAFRARLSNQSDLELKGRAYGFVEVPTSPFPHQSRSTGKIYQGTFYSATANYSDSRVAFYIPKNFNIQQSFFYLVYLHGWSNNLENVLRSEQLAQQLESSGKNAILVIPALAKDAADTSGGKLDERFGFKELMRDVKSKLAELMTWRRAEMNPGKIVLAAHSGGYSAMANILMQGGLPVQQVYLFDGLYWHRDRFLIWKERNPSANLTILFTDNGGTLRENEQLSRTVNGYHLQKKIQEINLPEFPKMARLPQLDPGDILLLNTGNTSHHNIIRRGYLELLLRQVGNNLAISPK